MCTLLIPFNHFAFSVSFYMLKFCVLLLMLNFVSLHSSFMTVTLHWILVPSHEFICAFMMFVFCAGMFVFCDHMFVFCVCMFLYLYPDYLMSVLCVSYVCIIYHSYVFICVLFILCLYFLLLYVYILWPYVCILCPYAFNLYRVYLMFVLCSYQILITPLVSSNSSYVCIWLSSLFCCLNSLSMLCVAFCISNFLFTVNTFSILYHMYVKLSWAFPVFSVIETCTYTHTQTSRASYIPWYVVL